jgi:drug/metabolite transporter (DMT)-like permease
MELWIPITIFAAFMQNLRSSLQKYLKGQLSTSGATYSRFAYAMPLALIYVAGLVVYGDRQLPVPTIEFLAFAVAGGTTQILATALLVYIFSLRNFVVGTTFSKTETAQTAVFGIIVLGETISIGATFAIAISLIGVLMISITRMTFNLRDLGRQCLQPTAVIGIASGALFGLSAVGYRAASLSLGSGDFIIRAALTLACATVFQTVIMSIYMRIREPGQITAVLRAWRVAGLVGIMGMLGSVGWVTAVTLQNAAYVRALGQIELLFTFTVSYFVFRERISRIELLGIFFVTAGILLLVFIR